MHVQILNLQRPSKPSDISSAAAAAAAFASVAANFFLLHAQDHFNNTNETSSSVTFSKLYCVFPFRLFFVFIFTCFEISVY